MLSISAKQDIESRRMNGAINPPLDARRDAQAVAIKDAAKRLKLTIL